MIIIQDSNFKFDIATNFPIAVALLRSDPQLTKMRFDLVPKQIKEHAFWHNYFYRVELIKNAVALDENLVLDQPIVLEPASETLVAPSQTSPTVSSVDGDVVFDWETELAKELEGHTI